MYFPSFFTDLQTTTPIEKLIHQRIGVGPLDIFELLFDFYCLRICNTIASSCSCAKALVFSTTKAK